MEALFAQLLPRAGVGGRWTSGSNIGVRLLKSCVGSALVKRYRAASAPSTCAVRSEEHTSELQSLMRISYAVFCLKKKTNTKHKTYNTIHKPKTTSDIIR